MANEEHLARLNQGVAVWNQWREENPGIEPYLSGADLRGEDLSKANLSRVYLTGALLHSATLRGANLRQAVLLDAGLVWANLHSADLCESNLTWANLTGVDFSKANLRGARLCAANLAHSRFLGADLRGAAFTSAHIAKADFSGADLTNADLTATVLLETNFEKANLTGCSVYGISAWNLRLAGAQQSDLIITPPEEPEITVDNLEVAQFIYLLLHNEKIREVIDKITSKAVLILGRFTPERKAVLEAIREEIRRQHLLPILFDFTPSASQTTVETVSTLAHMARFVIADLTDAKSVLQELQAIVPNNPSVPVQPILLASQEEPGMFDFIRRYPWVLETYRYHSPDDVLASLEQVIARAEKARGPSGKVSM